MLNRRIRISNPSKELSFFINILDL